MSADTVRACRQGEAEERGPGFCPTKVDPETQQLARALYDDPETRKISRESALVESEGYCKWTRVEEIVQFAKRMGYRKIGIANCISFVDHAYVLSGILESHGFEVVSVACKNGSIPKEELGIADHEKVRPGQFEALCNPIVPGRAAQCARLRVQRRDGLVHRPRQPVLQARQGADDGAGRQGPRARPQPGGRAAISQTAITAACGDPETGETAQAAARGPARPGTLTPVA